VTHTLAHQVAKAACGITDPRIKVGNLEAVRDFSDVADIVRAYLLLGEKGQTGGIYNIASGKGTRIADILDGFIKLSGIDIETVEDPARVRPLDIPAFVGDAKKIREMGWAPEVPLSKTLEDIYCYYAARAKQ